MDVERPVLTLSSRSESSRAFALVPVNDTRTRARSDSSNTNNNNNNNNQTCPAVRSAADIQSSPFPRITFATDGASIKYSAPVHPTVECTVKLLPTLIRTRPVLARSIFYPELVQIYQALAFGLQHSLSFSLSRE